VKCPFSIFFLYISSNILAFSFTVISILAGLISILII
jgi:hypothetical protein